MPIEHPQDPNYHLSREEVLLRRSIHAKQLLKLYRKEYWKLQEEIRRKLISYYWEFGKSPFEESEEIGEKGENERRKCGLNGCMRKAMPSTVYCCNHILEDKKQTLYKGCRFVTRSSPIQLRCNKPVLRGTVPSYCSAHNQKHQKQILQVLRKSGVNAVKTAPKFNVLLSECVREIQARRKAALKLTKNAVKVGKDSAGKDVLPPKIPEKIPFEQRALLQKNRGVIRLNPSDELLQKNKGVMQPNPKDDGPSSSS